MNVYEMEGFLRGKCVPRDLIVNESNAAYLVRKLSDIASVKAERDAQQKRADALAVENAALKAINDDRRMFIMNGVQLGYIKVPTVEVDPALETIRIAVSPQVPTPATDEALAAIQAQGVEKLIKLKMEQLARMHPDTHAFGATAVSLRAQINELQAFVNELREAK